MNLIRKGNEPEESRPVSDLVRFIVCAALGRDMRTWQAVKIPWKDAELSESVWRLDVRTEAGAVEVRLAAPSDVMERRVYQRNMRFLSERIGPLAKAATPGPGSGAQLVQFCAQGAAITVSASTVHEFARHTFLAVPIGLSGRAATTDEEARGIHYVIDIASGVGLVTQVEG